MNLFELFEDDFDDSEREYNELEEKINRIAEKYRLTNEHINFIWQIKDNCDSYLRQNPGAMSLGQIYRGIHSSQNTLTKKVRLDNRRPLDSNQSVHDELNKLFKEQFGEPFRNAMFCSSDQSQVSSYGEVYIIFPIGDFTFLWSPDVEDTFAKYEHRLSHISDEDFVYKLVAENDYYTDNLTKAIQSGNEIMMRCKRYYALRLSSLTRDQQNGMQLILAL